MRGEKIFRISVGGAPVGMVGLEEIFSQVKEKRNLSQGEIEKFLLDEAKKKNYIPVKYEGEYIRSLVKEFRKFMGEKIDEDFSVLQVRVLGMGCVNCSKLEQETMAALAELNLDADFDHVQDIREIGKFGVLGTPALVINGKVKSVGRVPKKEQIKIWLLEGTKEK